jgi:hypothetical protein
LKGCVLLCRISTGDISGKNPKFAFYVFRNERRIHVAWYSESPSFEFDTKGVSGCYRVVGFAKFDDGTVESVKSAPLFANPLKVCLSNFPVVDDQTIVYSLKGGFWTFPALYIPSERKSLFVLMPSAVDRKKMRLPAFHRWTWALKGLFPGDVLCVSDPTLELHDELQLGWFIGNDASCATTELSEFVVKLAESRGIPREKIVIYGSSAGGFAALALSACIEGSVAIAINAQVDAFSYYVPKQVELISKMCFSGMPPDAVKRNFPDRVNMISRWARVQSSRAFLIQNVLDRHHYEVHFKPFWKSLGGNPEEQEGLSCSGRHLAWIYRQEGGHIPETMEMAKEIIRLLKL